MINQRWWRALGVAIPAITGAMLLGMTKVFEVEASTNLFNTGVTLALILGIANIAISIAIYKNLI